MEQRLSQLTDFYKSWYKRFTIGWHQNFVNNLINFLASDTSRWTRTVVELEWRLHQLLECLQLKCGNIDEVTIFYIK
jgi:hypothetical protein